MLEKYFVHPDTLNGIRNCWLGEAIDKYVEWLVEQGYGPCLLYTSDAADEGVEG